MRSTLLRPLAGLLGLVCLVLGVVGVFLPLMPSTVFFIGAAACFAYASPRVEAWLLSFDFIGEPVRAWRERGAISRPAKIMASAGMIFSALCVDEAKRMGARDSRERSRTLRGFHLDASRVTIRRPA